MMKIYRVKDYDEMSRKAANIISAQITLKPNSVLGLATGSSPIGIYKLLVEYFKRGDLDFSGVTGINLDEYCGLSPENDQSYKYFMDDKLFNHVNINKENINIPKGLEKDSEKECKRYSKIIEKLGPVDLQLLGIGLNGHIGFNEPSDVFQNETHCVALSQSTIDANKRFFEKEEDVPQKAYTMGIGQIMKAKKILLVACGESKAEILYKSFFEPVTPTVPASILQFHKNVTLVCDEAALSKF